LKNVGVVVVDSGPVANHKWLCAWFLIVPMKCWSQPSCCAGRMLFFCFDFVAFVLFFNYFSQSQDDVFTLFVVELMCICRSGCFKAIREKHMNESDMMFLPNTHTTQAF